LPGLGGLLALGCSLDAVVKGVVGFSLDAEAEVEAEVDLGEDADVEVANERMVVTRDDAEDAWYLNTLLK
jgi:hypothetical protein